MILFDTSSILKLKILNTKFERMMDRTLEQENIGTTNEVIDEVLYFFPAFEKHQKNIIILPKLESKYYKLFSQKFDSADSTLLEYGKIKKFFVVTEDPKMLKTSIVMSIPSVQLCDFLYKLYQKNVFPTKDIRKIIKILRGMKNITKRKYKNLIKRLDQRV